MKVIGKRTARQYMSIGNGKCVEIVPATPKEHGKWVDGAENFSNGTYDAECKKCGTMIKWSGCSGDFNFCPNCGLKMKNP